MHRLILTIIEAIIAVGFFVYPLFLIAYFIGLKIVLSQKLKTADKIALKKLFVIKLIQTVFIIVVPLLICLLAPEFILPIEVYLVFVLIAIYSFLPIGIVTSLIYKRLFFNLKADRTSKVMVFIASSVPILDLIILLLLKAKENKEESIQQ